MTTNKEQKRPASEGNRKEEVWSLYNVPGQGALWDFLNTETAPTPPPEKKSWFIQMYHV